LLIGHFVGQWHSAIGWYANDLRECAIRSETDRSPELTQVVAAPSTLIAIFTSPACVCGDSVSDFELSDLTSRRHDSPAELVAEGYRGLLPREPIYLGSDGDGTNGVLGDVTAANPAVRYFDVQLLRSQRRVKIDVLESQISSAMPPESQHICELY
jgi:hypothetical protein